MELLEEPEMVPALSRALFFTESEGPSSGLDVDLLSEESIWGV